MRVIPNNIANCRERLGLGRSALSHALGVPEEQVERFEEGLDIDLYTANAVASVLGLLVQQVFPDFGDILFGKGVSTEERLTEMGPPEKQRFPLKQIELRLTGRTEPAQYFVTPVEDQKLAFALYEEMEAKKPLFVHFQSQGKLVYVRVGHLLMLLTRGEKLTAETIAKRFPPINAKSKSCRLFLTENRDTLVMPADRIDLKHLHEEFRSANDWVKREEHYFTFTDHEGDEIMLQCGAITLAELPLPDFIDGLKGLRR